MLVCPALHVCVPCPALHARVPCPALHARVPCPALHDVPCMLRCLALLHASVSCSALLSLALLSSALPCRFLNVNKATDCLGASENSFQSCLNQKHLHGVDVFLLQEQFYTCKRCM